MRDKIQEREPIFHKQEMLDLQRFFEQNKEDLPKDANLSRLIYLVS